MNKKSVIAISIVLLLTFNANAQIFWKISGNGLTKPSYLFGTHHLIEKEQIKNFDKALTICKESDAVVGEILLADMANNQMKMMQGSIMQGTTCKDLLSEEDYTLIDGEFKQLMGAGLEQLGTMKPMMLNTLYMVMTYFKINNLTKQPEAIDDIFQNTATENGKKVLALETIEQQIDILFNSIPLKRQAEILVKDIKDKDEGIDGLKKLNELYLVGDLVGAENLNSENESMTPEEENIMIYNRNNNWMKQIPELIKTQQCFIAVGFLHLAGETGLVNQLKNAGYKVEAVEL